MTLVDTALMTKEEALKTAEQSAYLRASSGFTNLIG